MTRPRLKDFYHRKPPAYADDIRAAGVFHEVDFSQREAPRGERDDWPLMHSWCQERFTEEHYTWTGHQFWFEKRSDALWFTIRWVWGIEDFLNTYPFAIRYVGEGFQNPDWRKALEVERTLVDQYGVTTTLESHHNFRWLGLQSERDAMYARLLLPGHIFMRAKDLGDCRARSD